MDDTKKAGMSPTRTGRYTEKRYTFAHRREP